MICRKNVLKCVLLDAVLFLKCVTFWNSCTDVCAGAIFHLLVIPLGFIVEVAIGVL